MANAPARASLVVIVDDDESVRRSTDRLVRSFGYRTQVFGSGDELLESGSAALADCLLLDVRMPGASGLDVQRTLIERGVRAPILFLTARASDDEERRARSAGAIEFLRKPLAEAKLRQAIASAIAPRACEDDGGA